MKLAAEIKTVRTRYVAVFPVPQGEPGPAFEEQVRQWSIRFAEQVAYDVPGQGYGTKRASPTRPISKDSLARNAGDTLLSWDLLIGAGTGQPRLIDDPDSKDITGQVFVRVTPTNHVAGAPPPPDPPTEPPGPTQPYPAEETWWKAFEAEQAALYATAGQSVNWAAFRWSSRTGYDIGAGMEKDAAKAKHLAELRAELGL
jgi:hypothetical protein